MFERFTQAARETVVQAQHEARALGHDYIGTEHLLLGLAAAGDGVADEVLSGFGVTPDALRRAIEEIIGSPLDAGALAAIGIDLAAVRRRIEASFGPGALERGRPQRCGQIPFTPRAKRVLELALREARSLGHGRIGSEHVLLGLLREGEGVAIELLRRSGAPPDRLRAALLERLSA